MWFSFLLATLFIYFYGLGNFPLTGPDEPRYAQVAREMLDRADIVTPTLGGFRWFEKPALPYWAMMASFSVLGVSEYSARLPFAVAGLFVILILLWITQKIERLEIRQERLLYAVVVVAGSSLGLIVFSHAVNFDIFLTATISFALLCFLAADLDPGQRKTSALAGFYLGIGASLLAKGLVGMVLPLGAVVLYYVLSRRLPTARVLKSLLWGIPLAFGVAAIWYLPVIQRNGWEFVDEFFLQHHFQRYISNKYRHPQPFYFFIMVLLLMTPPWTIFLLSSLWRVRRWSWRSDSPIQKTRNLSLAWLAVVIVFFSFSESKLPGYILPALPAAALLAGDELARYLRNEIGSLLVFLTGVLLLIGVVAGLYAAMQIREISFPCAVAAAIPILLLSPVVFGMIRSRTVVAASVALAFYLSCLVALICAAEPVAARQSTRDLFRTAAARGYETLPVLHLQTIERTAQFYAAGRNIYSADGDIQRFEEVEAVEEMSKARGGAVLVIVPTKYESQLTDNDRLDAVNLGNNGRDSLIAVSAKSRME